ncbi:putative serine protease K12H4.7 [Episyrphus balteatus]|uniref:putative serine protease K12H4.7 n=1 Tax=Episyrphus balteatus TaxID=286459 RepID=UPI0024869DBC|nr:putative serine protease K12H4.7 [Episyrphus balteatus]
MRYFILLVCLAFATRITFGKRLFSNGFIGAPSKFTLASQSQEPQLKWFQQILDHSNPTKYPKWKQRYYVSNEHYKTGGPIFLMIGGEGKETPKWMTSGAWIHYAAKFNALCFSLEHRFYGASQPTKNLSTENLQYLTSEQALADLANFVREMKVKYDLKDSQKWIAFGGSYPGSLAAWVREKYPELIHGSISSSGPLLAEVDFKEYFEVVQNSLASYSDACVIAVRRSFAQLEILLRHMIGQREINEKFQLCDPIEKSIENKLDISNLFENIAGNFAGVVQYNKDNSPHAGKTIDDVCDVMVNETLGTPVQRLAEVNRMLLKDSGEKCLDYKYDKMIVEMQNTTWDEDKAMRQWTYQTCNEFGFYQTSTQKDSLFTDRFPVDFFIRQCMDIFSEKMDSQYLKAVVGRTNTFYGALNPNTTNVLYVHGSIDPWHALGLITSSNPNTPTLYIEGTAHCANMYEPSANDLPSLVAARKKIQNYIENILSS